MLMGVAGMGFDLVIAGGKVVDGTGNPWFWADVGIRGGRVEALVRVRPGEGSPLAGLAAAQIDARGKVVAPGFIDMHSHSDYPLLVNPPADSKIMQGVTTEVIGQCGTSLGPVTDRSLPLMRQSMRGLPDVGWDWRTYGDYLDRVARQGTGVNVIGLVGHGTIRRAVMGMDQRRPTESELNLMCGLARESVEQGAWGMSTGLIYTPGSYAETPELVTIARAAATAGGMYFTHVRSEGPEGAEAIAEAIEVGEKANVPVQISHLKTRNLGEGGAAMLLGMLEDARRRGVEWAADQYPYTASSTGLAALLPPWVHEGGREDMVSRLKDPASRARIRTEMQGRLPDWPNDFRGISFDHLQIAQCLDKSLEGRRLGHVAAELGRDPYDVTLDLLAYTDPGTRLVIHGILEEDVQTIMRHGLVMVGSDGSALSPTGPLSQGLPHPRNYGTFPRVLAKYVREERVLTLEQAVRKMTSAQATRLGLKDRGQLREGGWADVVVFDADTVQDRATFREPHQFPAGTSHVIVNGVQAVAEGVATGALAGQVLRMG